MGLTIYKASAGSGKTYTLAVEIIAVLLKQPDAYKHILAATFTNKAAGELKTRVVNVLSQLSKADKEKGYFDKIKEKTGFPEKVITQRAKLVLRKILHDYSRLSISTIDRFFNKILSSFLYEVNIRPDSEITLDDKVLREEALDKLLAGFDVNTKLGKWLMDYARLNIEDEKNWNIRNSLLDESETITKEGFLAREQELEKFIQDRSKLVNYRNDLLAIIKKHETELRNTGRKSQEILADSPYSLNDFSNNKSGPAGFLSSLAIKGFRDITGRAEKAVADPMKFLNKNKQSDDDLVHFVEEKLHPLLCYAVSYMQKHEKDYFSALAIYSNINSFGVLLDINHELRKLCRERHVYFTFQMAQMLYDIVSFDNAMWVYEKMGTRYLHYFLDEFQDTSRMQWDIIKPLLEESLGSDGSNLIVGDVKQSVYRWRNGDWTMLSHEVQTHFPQAQINSLNYNFRSRRDIVHFNNHLMSALLPVFQQNIDAELTGGDEPEFDLSALYDHYIQIPNKTEPPFGHVKIRFISSDEQEDWHEKAMDEMISEMKILMDKGYSQGDMAVLVNKNKEGGILAQRLMEEDRSSEYNFPVVSPASLLLKENSLIQIILSALTWIDQPENNIALTQLVHTYQTEVLNNKNYIPDKDSNESLDIADAMTKDLPSAFVALKNNMAGWPLYDLTENIIQWFDLHKHSEGLAYLNAFQDHVLQFSQNNPVEISGFLTWFDKKTPKLEMPDSAGSIVISTIHKAKGLEFRFVFMPFTDWELTTSGKADRIWVEPNTSPFDQLPLMIVNADSKLDKSHFSKSYKVEKFNQRVDMLNKFYVAITRAEEGLFIWGPQKKGKSRMHTFLQIAVENAGNGAGDNKIKNWNTCLNSEKTCFEFGDVPAYQPDAEQKKQAVLMLDVYPLSMPVNNMRYHHPGAFLDLREDETIRQKTNLGSVSHAILEQVQTIDDLSDSTEQLIREGRISHEKARELKQMLDLAMKKEPVRSWFRNNVTVINEQDILLEGGGFVKPDRVVVEGDRAEVIDYKFGKRNNKKYIEQVRGYMQKLLDMGYKHVKGYVWYVLEGEVQEVCLET